MHLHLRDEYRSTERRSPLLPDGAEQLISAGHQVSVERSTKRVISDQRFAESGCTLVPPGSWVSAPPETIVLGLKELPDTPAKLVHRHIYFAHAFKNQAGWQQTIERFARGGGRLYDLEYLVNQNGRRVVAFGYWAGYLGAALALLHWLGGRDNRQSPLAAGLAPYKCASDLDGQIAAQRRDSGAVPKCVVVGALGRSGSGAVDLLARHGCAISKWDMAETNPIDRSALLDHDILINCVLLSGKIEPFITKDDTAAGNRLSVICDVSCDPGSAGNPLPIYDAPTTWQTPVRAIGALDLIAIDNLPSLLPRESSDDFARGLLPYLLTFEFAASETVWSAAERSFEAAVGRLSELENL